MTTTFVSRELKPTVPSTISGSIGDRAASLVATTSLGVLRAFHGVSADARL
jgi:hypothetical protein